MDPIDPRRTGIRRLRLTTVAVAGSALVGTAALTVVVAQAHPAAATSAESASGGSSAVEPTPGAPSGLGHASGDADASSGAS